MFDDVLLHNLIVSECQKNSRSPASGISGDGDFEVRLLLTFANGGLCRRVPSVAMVVPLVNHVDRWMDVSVTPIDDMDCSAADMVSG